MNKTKESSIAGAERPDKKEKLKRGVKKLGALALSVAAAVGIWHEAHKPAMDSEQMREATSIAAEAVSDKIGEFEGKDPRYVDEDGDYSSYRNDKGDDISVFAYNTGSEYKNPITGDISKPGTYVRVTLENNSNRGKRDKKGTLSRTGFTFKSDNPRDFDNLMADGQLTIDEAKDFINSGRVSISEIKSVVDINGDDALIDETLEYSALDGGDDNWRLRIDEQDGVSGVDKGKDGLSGESAVEQVQRVVDMVQEDNWGESK